MESQRPGHLATRLRAKKKRYDAALDALVEKLKEDHTVLAAVLVGSLSEAVIWKREAIGLWIVETDDVERRHLSDGKDERLFRTLTVDDLNFHAEMIPRGRFKRMIEGSSRTAFSHSFFAERRLLFSHDPSIDRWFDDANRLAVKDQRRELMVTASWAVHPLRHAVRLLDHKDDVQLARQELLGTVWALAAMEIVRTGQVCEDEIVYRAAELNPELFEKTWNVLVGGAVEETASPGGDRGGETRLREVIATIREYLDAETPKLFKPLLDFLKKEGRIVALSEICDHFAYTQLYPWHLESSCEHLARKGLVEKVVAPYRLTTKSRVELEEPAYLLVD